MIQAIEKNKKFFIELILKFDHYKTKQKMNKAVKFKNNNSKLNEVH